MEKHYFEEIYIFRIKSVGIPTDFLGERHNTNYIITVVVYVLNLLLMSIDCCFQIIYMLQ